MSSPEDFNNLEDLMKKWIEDGPKEPAADDTTGQRSSFIEVQLTNGEIEDFEDATIADFGHRIVVAEDGKMVVFTAENVVRYELNMGDAE